MRDVKEHILRVRSDFAAKLKYETSTNKLNFDQARKKLQEYHDTCTRESILKLIGDSVRVVDYRIDFKSRAEEETLNQLNRELFEAVSGDKGYFPETRFKQAVIRFRFEDSNYVKITGLIGSFIDKTDPNKLEKQKDAKDIAVKIINEALFSHMDFLKNDQKSQSINDKMVVIDNALAQDEPKLEKLVKDFLKKKKHLTNRLLQEIKNLNFIRVIINL